jgi:chitinase
MNTYDLDLYSQVTGLKHDNPSLKVYISIGGWDAGGAVFSAMCSSSANRAAFINSLLSLMKTYAFDGVDLDWEYPGAADRGGTDADFANLTTFMAQLKSSLGGYGVTMTLPSSYWYLQHFDVVGLQKNVDWFNFMSYDIHGTWDGNNPYVFLSEIS